MKTITQKHMTLEIPLRKVGNSLMLTIPSDIIKLYGLNEGDKFEVVPDRNFFILKVKNEKG